MYGLITGGIMVLTDRLYLSDSVHHITQAYYQRFHAYPDIPITRLGYSQQVIHTKPIRNLNMQAISPRTNPEWVSLSVANM
jgi:hypothetical protein